MKKVLFSLVTLAIVVAFLEIASSIYYYEFATAKSREMLEPLLGIASPERQDLLRYTPHPYFNYVFNREYRYADGFMPYNSRGFRAPEWPEKRAGTLRIVAVGGSTTYGIFSRDGKDVWPSLLEKQLNPAGAPPVEVLNLGVTGYTLFEIMGVMGMVVPDLNPDVVVINAGVNDAFSACYPDEGGGDNTRFRFSWNVPRFPEIARFGMRKSYTLRVLGSLAMSVNKYLPGDLMTAMQYPNPGDEESRRNAAAASGKYFRRNLKAVVAQAERAGAVAVLVTQPLNPDWETPPTPFLKGVVGAHRRNNEIIREVGRESGAVVIDVSPPMRDGGLFVDAVHSNQRGEMVQAGLMLPQVKGVVAAIRDRAPAASAGPKL